MIQRPSRRGNRPRALDVSFGLEDPDDSASATTSDAGRKRDRGDAGDVDIRGAKRRNLDSVPQPGEGSQLVHTLGYSDPIFVFVGPARKYDPRKYEIEEDANLLIFGEEPDLPDDGKKRTRVLSRFSFFDADSLDMVSLDCLDEAVNGNQRILGAGFIVAKYDVDEDEGQEDGIDEESQRQYVRLSRVLRYFTRYAEPNSSFFIETKHAVYELDVSMPSKKYRSQFRPFWRLQSTLRFVISSADVDPGQEYYLFKRAYESKDNEVFGEPMTERELWDAVPKLRDTLETVPYGDTLRKSTVIQYLLSRLPPIIFKPSGKPQIEKNLASQFDLPIVYDGSGDIDTAVLRAKTLTRVTPRIAGIAVPLFREKLRVVGPKPRAEAEVPTEKLALRLQQLLFRAQARRLVQFRPDQRIGRSRWLKHILIDGEKYEVGDIVLIYAGGLKDIPPDPDDLPPTDTLADHFWFGKIIHMNEEHETVHVQWLVHSSQTLLQELGHAQELFLVNECDTPRLRHIIGKVKTHYIKPDQSLAEVQQQDYFYRYFWDEHDGTFTDIDMNALAVAEREPPGDNCPACELHKNSEDSSEPNKIHLGVRWLGVDYHLDDCVLIKADDQGPCHIGHIIDFLRVGGNEKFEVVVRLFGRIDRIGCRPNTTIKDERHLFYTPNEMTTTVSKLLGVCYVVVKEDMPELDAWLAMSPYRFYVQYRFPSLLVTSWDSRRRMHWNEFPICHMCLKQDLKMFKGTEMFLENETPLRVLDPFSGVGAFSLALQELGCFKLTHAVEIAPSAADTLQVKAASPNTKVYNQCSSLVLEHAILTHERKSPDLLKSVEGKSLPAPFKPGDIDCIVTGFPCQPHSTLNMFQKANDNKSTLMLTALSYVDFLKPKYCIFENVRGFLQYRLRGCQDGKHAVKGGIPMGGVKLVAAALLDMGYQFRCALLQAGHYGTPQTRIRFFLIAAKRGLELPQFPQPTHDFPVTDALEIRFPEGPRLDPITTLSGVAPHRYVSVHDAISDLPKFEWKHPKENLSTRQMEQRRVKECRGDDKWCGYHGPNVPYEHPPQTRFQQQCRSRPTKDIQQYTRTYDPKKVERIVEIPVEANADYRSLPRHLWEWQFANPASAAARLGFRGGYYGRVQRDKWFQTTVANVDPMAKQCRVIHPYSKRIVTIRELARSQGIPDHFVFHARNNRIKTMYRQIGNAVPWPVSIAIGREFLGTLYKEWTKVNQVEDLSDVVFSDPDDEMDVD